MKVSGKHFMDIVPVDTKRERDASDGFGESTEDVMALRRLSFWTRVHLPAIAKEQVLVVHKRHLFGSRMLTMIYRQLVVQDTVSAPCCSRCATIIDYVQSELASNEVLMDTNQSRAENQSDPSTPLSRISTLNILPTSLIILLAETRTLGEARWQLYI